MKNIISKLLAGVLAVGFCACSDTVSNDEFSDMLKEDFNQELKWNPDSLSFVRAEWNNTDLKGGAVYGTTTVKMWNGHPRWSCQP